MPGAVRRRTGQCRLADDHRGRGGHGRHVRHGRHGCPRSLDDLADALPARCGRHRGTQHGRCSRPCEHARSTAQCGPCGGDIVDHEDSASGYRGRRPELGVGDPGGSGAPRLRVAALSLQQPPAWQAELAGNGPGDQLCLVKAPAVATMPIGRCPGDDVDIDAGSDTVSDQAVDQQATKVPGQRTAVGVLEPQQHVARPATERHGGEHTWRRGRRRAQQGEPAGTAQHGPTDPTTSTTFYEDHADRCTRGVLHHERRAVRDTAEFRGSWQGVRSHKGPCRGRVQMDAWVWILIAVIVLAIVLVLMALRRRRAGGVVAVGRRPGR